MRHFILDYFIRQSLSLLHLFKFFVVRQVCGPVVGSRFYCACVCCGSGSDLSDLLRVGNFRGLNARTSNGPLDVIFSVRGVICSSKGYMSRLCWPVPGRHAQALEKKKTPITTKKARIENRHEEKKITHFLFFVHIFLPLFMLWSFIHSYESFFRV